MSLVVAENITKDYRVGEVVVPALRGVSFAIDPASFVSFIGPSGSGNLKDSGIACNLHEYGCHEA
jgi:putative ABC transport system ATP-binding protein